MKFKNKYILLTLCSIVLALTSCDKEDFIELNTNPETLYTIEPQSQFLNATIDAHSGRFEWYYDNYRRIMPWMQMSTATLGNAKDFMENSGNVNGRYSRFYGGVGSPLIDLNKLVEKLPVADQAKYTNMRAISNVLLAYYAFYTTDTNGSMPFKEAFQARYGGTFTPIYDTQEELYVTLDALLKASTTTLKANPSGTGQTSLGQYDLYFNGDAVKWVKAANALRLKMAMRLMKRDPNKMKAIALEVLASPADLMSSNIDSWVFEAKASFTESGDWDAAGFRAPKPTVDFMNTNADPRIGIFYKKNSLGNYVGSFTSPDAAALPANQALYTTPGLLSDIQNRLFQANFSGGDGSNFFPVITYADFTFMRAELAARGVTAESASTLYNAGIAASIQMYSDWAIKAKIPSYVAVTNAEITAYLAKPAIAYNAAKNVEQICIQSYINYNKQPNEAWALFKRTGFPNTTSALAFENIVADGIVQKFPRRAPLSLPPPTAANYLNNKAALDAMALDPGFGTAPSDFYGRVWWDKN